MKGDDLKVPIVVPMGGAAIDQRSNGHFRSDPTYVVRTRLGLVVVLFVAMMFVWVAIDVPSPGAVLLLALFGAFLLMNVRPALMEVIDLRLGEEGIRARSLLGHEKFVAWRSLVGAELLPKGASRHLAEIRLLNPAGRTEIVATSKLRDFDRIVEILRARIETVDSPPRRQWPFTNVTSFGARTPPQPTAGQDRVTIVGSEADKVQVRGKLRQMLVARGFTLRNSTDWDLDGSNGWTEVRVGLRDKDAKTVATLAFVDGHIPRIGRLVTTSVTAGVFLSWALLQQGRPELLPVLILIIALQAIAFVLVNQVTAAHVRYVTQATRDAVGPE